VASSMSVANKRVAKLLQHIGSDTADSVQNEECISNKASVRKIIYRQYPAEPLSSLGTLRGKTIFITGGSRGIGLAVALKCARDRCNIVIAAKTATLHPTLPGTIYTAARQIEECGSSALPLVCDIRSEEAVRSAVAKCVEAFGPRIDVLINNASAINLTNTERQSMKKYDLMNSVNARGTYMVTKYCIPYLKQSPNPHILTMSPPLEMKTKWFSGHIAYSVAKYGMSMASMGWADELRKYGIASNALWPRNAIATAAVKHILGGDYSMNRSRTPAIMADAAYLVLLQNAKTFNGCFVIDEDVLRCVGVTDFQKYKVNPNIKDHDLLPDFFLSN